MYIPIILLATLISLTVARTIPMTSIGRVRQWHTGAGTNPKNLEDLVDSHGCNNINQQHGYGDSFEIFSEYNRYRVRFYGDHNCENEDRIGGPYGLQGNGQVVNSSGPFRSYTAWDADKYHF